MPQGASFHFCFGLFTWVGELFSVRVTRSSPTVRSGLLQSLVRLHGKWFFIHQLVIRITCVFQTKSVCSRSFFITGSLFMSTTTRVVAEQLSSTTAESWLRLVWGWLRSGHLHTVECGTSHVPAPCC